MFPYIYPPWLRETTQNKAENKNIYIKQICTMDESLVAFLCVILSEVYFCFTVQ